MRIEINKPLADRMRQIATYLFLGTLVVLVGGFIFVNYSLFTDSAPPSYLVILQAMVLPLAFVFTIISVRLTNNWARRPFPEEALQENMKGISRRSVMYHYYHFPARHVLIAPQGVFVFTTRWHNKRYTVNGDKWKTHQNPIRRFFSLIRFDGIGNPTVDAKHAAEYIEKLLAPIAPDVEVYPVIVFTDTKADITIEDSDVPIVYADEKETPNLTDYLRSINQDKQNKKNERARLPLTDEQIEAFEAKTIGK